MYMFSHFIAQISDYTEMASQEVRQQLVAFFFVSLSLVPTDSLGRLDAWSALKKKKITIIIIKRPFTRF